MKHVLTRYILMPVLAVAVLTQCKKEETATTPPIAAFKLTPDTGLTTTRFEFDASASQATSASDTMLFIRWDWDNDNIWDTGFSRSKTFTHRYYVPGTYTAVMEIRNVAGQSDTTQTTVTVGRGYSAPQPSLTVLPVSGNTRTEFVFDASKTIDDEDSLNTLKFRWDWDGNGYYDTEYSDQPIITHSFTSSSVYNTILQVIDPKGLTAKATVVVTVSINNPNLVPQFTWSPEAPTTSDTVVLDASSSYDPDNAGNTFTYRWDFNGDGTFDTDFLSGPTCQHQFTTEGDNTVNLEIRDQWGLINQKKNKIYVAHSNLKPTATFFIGYEYGNLTTNFYFDASAVHDQEDYIDILRVRWDFESDGIWDTDYAKAKTTYHKYSKPGTYRAKVQVIDSGGLTDTTSQVLYIGEGTNETGLIIDLTKGVYYGTVKLGNQWWMAENLNDGTGKVCYSNSSANCAKYGGLYAWNAAMSSVTTEKAQGLCPSGWHIPTLAEWTTLLDYYGADSAKSHLLVGGDSDFRMFYAGQRSTAGRSEMLDQVTSFWTSTKSTGENAIAISFQKDQDAYFRLNLSRSYSFSVRCIKD